MKKKYFGTDGIRGRVGDFPITPEFVMKLGWAAGRVLGKHNGGLMLIGKDTRISGYMFESALEAGLSAAGVDIRLLGPMPTPAIAYLTQTLHASGGIVISASHNHYEDNGIKFFSQYGQKLPDQVELEIETELEKPMQTVDSGRLGKAERMEDAGGRYIEFCKSTVPNKINLSGLKIVIDAAHGATYAIAPNVYQELGAKVINIGIEPDGFNINAQCGSVYPELLRETVLNQRADVGIALDGDGDRLIMVDHKGELIDGDEILYIIAKDRQKAKRLGGVVVGTVMTNLGLEHAFDKQGIELKRAQVGDRYVLELLQQGNWVLGGESSGHIICLDCTTTGDGIVSSLQVLMAMQQAQQSLNEIKQGMHKYPQCLINVRIQEKVDPLSFDTIKQAIAEAESQLGNRGRVLLRSSGTEPVIRVMVEGQELAQVERIAEYLAGVVQEQLASA